MTHHNTHTLKGETIGILAGWGRFPLAVAEAIRRRGGRTAVLSIRDHADAAIELLADEYGTVGVAEIGKAIDFFVATACVVPRWPARFTKPSSSQGVRGSAICPTGVGCKHSGHILSAVAETIAMTPF